MGGVGPGETGLFFIFFDLSLEIVRLYHGRWRPFDLRRKMAELLSALPKPY